MNNNISLVNENIKKIQHSISQMQDLFDTNTPVALDREGTPQVISKLFPHLSDLTLKKLKSFSWSYNDSFSYETIINYSIFPEAIAILKDEILFISPTDGTKEAMQKKKLLLARRNNPDFTLDIACMISGDNQKFPYRSSSYITKFFKDLGYPFTHSGQTRRIWIKEELDRLDINDLYKVISGIFRRKDFEDIAKIKNTPAIQLLKEAIDELRNSIETSARANDFVDISSAFDLSINNELLFNKVAATDDSTLNELIDAAKKYFLDGDKQVALEKLWDAFERLKTLPNGKDKKSSSKMLCQILSREINTDFFESEFVTLTKIGNDYQIRHHEKGKKSISDTYTKEYLFFRVLSLIDLAIIKIGLLEEN